MTPTEALRRVAALPLCFQAGQTLAEGLRTAWGLTVHDSEALVDEYRRFLALALTADKAEPTMPSPLVEAVWHLHRSAPGHAEFLAGLGSAELADRLTCHRALATQARETAYRSTRARLMSAFGDLTPKWWPSPAWLRWREHWAEVAAFGLLFGLSLAAVWHWPPKTGLERALGLLVSLGVTLTAFHFGQKGHPLMRITTPAASFAQSPKIAP